ncbi:hypothetical protein MNBD_BACTEROID01-2221 [hydrothermal vent metagenome]|uniref:Uncharacterized protein n=1 Tax=hydrothermal vent metagenome TaxID=652676 RepID=A0A3B0TJK4_9ZZZZ
METIISIGVPKVKKEDVAGLSVFFVSFFLSNATFSNKLKSYI